MNLTEQPFVVFDTETTGHHAAGNDRIVEIGAVRIVDGRVRETFETLVNPQREIPYYATNIHHISDEMVEEAPVIRDVLFAKGGFLDFIGLDPLVAHNAAFDMRFVNHTIKEILGHDLYNVVIDTLRVVRKRLPELPNHKLGTVATHFNISFPAHTALGDAMMTAGVFSECLLMDLSRGIERFGELCREYGFKHKENATRGMSENLSCVKFKPSLRRDY